MNRRDEEMRIHEDLFVNGQVCACIARRRHEFIENIEKNLKPAIESERRKNNFDWATVRSFYNSLRSKLDSLWSLKVSCRYALTLFHMFDCEDDLLFKQIIYIYYQVLLKYDSFDLCANCMHVNFVKHLNEESNAVFSILSTVSKAPLHGYSFSNFKFYEILARTAFFKGEYILMKVLVKYGLCDIPINAHVSFLYPVTSELEQLYDFYRELTVAGRNDRELDEIELNEKLIQILSDFKVESKTTDRKIFLIMKYVFVCFRKLLGERYYADYVKCLNLYVLTMSETTVSVKDVKIFLEVLCSHDRAFITVGCSLFRELFKESPILSSPRELKYLCRCKVRDWIKSHWCASLPAVLATMLIPSELKTYLMLSDY